jgi:DNA-3-methyladenine glycosylase II
VPARITPAEAAAVLAQRDRVLAKLRAAHGPPRLPRPAPPGSRFAAVAESIVYQQLHGKAAASIHGRLVARLGGDVSAELLVEAGTGPLRACGLSAAKTAALLDLAGKVLDGTVRLERMGRLDDDAVVDELVKVKGIGRWTAEMFLIFTLGRLDVWPVGDYGVRVGYARAWGLPEAPRPSQLQDLGDRFRPYRTVAAWYCWRSVEQR